MKQNFNLWDTKQLCNEFAKNLTRTTWLNQRIKFHKNKSLDWFNFFKVVVGRSEEVTSTAKCR